MNKKSTNWRLPILLSIIVLVLSVFAYWLQFTYKMNQEKMVKKNKKPIQLESFDQIAQFRINGPNGLFEFTCESFNEKTCYAGALGKWNITNPLNTSGSPHPAYALMLNGFLPSATSPVAIATIDLSNETPEKRKLLLSEYGLSDVHRKNKDAKFFEVVLADEHGKPGKRITLWYGTDHPVEVRTFALAGTDGIANENTVYLLLRALKNYVFTKTLKDFQEK